ncbi:hypothetical protein L2E82_06245 [Cichorium intybus]|uniref:Uncharacterized protein n=1 Tax=Cichorium intybus TaxID=13427 RepID=A0ACB9H917_CICIN|nr:hypothetical protein L2E82_06245 [Cichorium intybus]
METVHDLIEKAKTAFIDDNFLLAVNYYTQAINLSPQNADLYAERAQSNIKLNNITEAIDDLDRAIELDRLMAKAYLRKGAACIKLEKYHTAMEALLIGSSLSQNDTRFAKLIKECNEHISGEESNSVPIEVDKRKYRHSFYQKPDEVVVTIFAKGIPTENVMISYGEQILSVIINTPGEPSYRFQPRLYRKIVPEKCKYEVLKTKVEIRLVKAELINWKSLEYPQDLSALQENKPSGRPSYPSSNQRVPDWDKLEAQVKKEEKEEKLDGDVAANKMFGDIYKNADEDMRRAMNKSYVESNGTVLSTCWKEVGKKKIEPSPPDNMELRKWEY